MARNNTAPAILVVDDTPTNLAIVENTLAAEGFRTLTAGDGPSARAISRAESPDLILLDVVMPGETGFETCAKLKSDPLTADIPIIFLSALDDVENKVAGLKIGGVDYVSKPVHPAEVLARVRVHLRIRENNRMLINHNRERLEQLRNAQMSILAKPEECQAASCNLYYKPLEEAGGDFYDFFEIDPDVFGYFVADVSGHGISAAFVTSAIKALLRQYCGPMYSPEDTMRGIDSVMRSVLDSEQYLTACYARLNRRTRQLSIVSAGHPAVIVVDRQGNVRTVEMGSEPLGVFQSVVLQRQDLKIAKGDRFYLYTDGFIESAPGGGRREGLETLIAACVKHREVPLNELAARIADELRPPSGEVTDDLLLLAVEVPL